MIAQEQIKKLAIKYQTTQLNTEREYFQHLFLSYFYQQPQAKNIYFKGGTALRIIYSSPRFSEDLDFSAKKIKIKDVEQTLVNSLDEIEKENIDVVIKEAKTTSRGYLAHVVFEANGIRPILIEIEISLRQTKTTGEVISINNDFMPPYTIFTLSLQHLVDEKIQALLFRKKPRDFYDLYFILRSNLLTASKKGILSKALKTLRKTKINFEKELKLFLPKTHWALIRDFKNILEQEIQRS